MDMGDIVRARTVRSLLAPGAKRGGWIEWGAEKGEHLVLLALGRCKDGEDADPVLRLMEIGWTPPAQVLIAWSKRTTPAKRALAKRLMADAREVRLKEAR